MIPFPRQSFFVTVKMDRATISTLHVFPQEQAEDTNLQVQKQLEIFILEFRLDNVFVYRYGAVISPFTEELAYT